MNILYCSNLCSKEKFDFIFEKSKIKPGLQIQKFNMLFSKGLAHHVSSLNIISRPPITTEITKEFYLIKESDVIDNIEFNYVKLSNNQFLNPLRVFIYTMFFTLKWLKKNKNSFEDNMIICDSLNLTMTLCTYILSKLFRFYFVGIMTDLPDYLSLSNFDIKESTSLKSLVYKNIVNFLNLKFDYYIILSEYMNKKLNRKNKPYLVLEGLVDTDMSDIENFIQNKYMGKVCIYSGLLSSKYGVKSLVDAFCKITAKDIELWIYGEGELEDYIKEICESYKNIKYYGLVKNDILVLSQTKATLLINPRPSNEDFSKYSFPSKLMEYMASGTPVITTKIQSLPLDYFDYVYFFENESVEGLKNSIEDILKKNIEDLHKFGLEAKRFVLDKKNYIVQTKKIIDMINIGRESIL